MRGSASPRAAFDRVTHHQAVLQRCNFFTPTSVTAGADRDITVGVELENTRNDQPFDHVWRVEVAGQGLGFKTTHVSAGETVTDSQTRTIPSDLLPTGGGSVDVVIQQIGGFQQTSRCGSLEVLPAGEPEPRFDPALVSLDGCEITPREVDPGDQFVYSVFLSNGNPEPVDVNLTWSFSGGVLDRDLSRTVPAGASGHELTFETTTEIARLAPGQTVDVTIEVTNSDVGIALSGSCGQVSVTGGFDEAKVFVPADECTVSPQQVTPPHEVSLSATVVNDNLFSAIAEVWWTWQGLRIAFVEVPVDAESRTTAQATATIEREGRDQVRARVERASGGLASTADVTPSRTFRRVFP